MSPKRKKQLEEKDMRVQSIIRQYRKDKPTKSGKLGNFQERYQPDRQPDFRLRNAR